MEEIPKSPVSATSPPRIKTQLSPNSPLLVGSSNSMLASVQSNDSQGSSSLSKRAARLSDRIQHRLNKRNSSRSGAPLSPRSDSSDTASNNNNVKSPYSPRLNGENGMNSPLSPASARKYGDRVNSLLLTHTETEEVQTKKEPDHNTLSPENDSPKSTMDKVTGVVNGVIDQIDHQIAAAHDPSTSYEDGEDEDREETTHYSTADEHEDDDDDGDEGDEENSSSSRFTQEAMTLNTGSATTQEILTMASGSTMSTMLQTPGRSFSPIYDGIGGNDITKENKENEEETNDENDVAKEAQEEEDASADPVEAARAPSDTDEEDQPENLQSSEEKDNAKNNGPASPTTKKVEGDVEGDITSKTYSIYGTTSPSVPSKKPMAPPAPTLEETKEGNDAASPAAAEATPDSPRQTKSSEQTNENNKSAPASPGSPDETKEQDQVSKKSAAEEDSPSNAAKRTRVPGGAAAKLMLMGPKKSEEEGSSSDEERATTIATKASGDSELHSSRTANEINSEMAKTKNEFSVGSEQNRRYQRKSNPSTIHEDEEESDTKLASLSTIGSKLLSSRLFDRTEVFHPDANAAVSALLTPRATGTGSDIMSVTSGTPSDVHSVYSGSQSMVSSAFQTPKSVGGEYSSAFESLARHDVSLQLISEETGKKMEKIKETMRDPDQTLADLLTAINTEEDFEQDLGFTVRRKNACGALQLMTSQAKNQVPIAWTVGVLPALTSVLRDTGEEGLHVSFPDKRHRLEFEAARNRAISCLMNLSMPPRNRIAVFHTPSLVQWLLVIINEGNGLPRKGATAILAYLGKTEENRLLMVQVPGLVDSLTIVLKPQPPRIERMKVVERKLKEFGSDREEGALSVNSSFSNESDATPRFNGSQSPVEINGYDETADEFLRASRQNTFALLLHLVKEKDNCYHLARHDFITATLSLIANQHDSPSHLLAVKILACLTRHRLNTKTLVFKQRDVVPAMVHATTSTNDTTRLFSCYALQNLAQDKSCRQELAVAPDLISALCDRSRKAKGEEERLAAISAIKNLCDEPANLIPMTNTPDCIATLMHLAHGMEEGITEMMQYRACDALATLSHWLRKIATSGQALENAKAKKPPPKTLFVPSLQVVPYNQWK